MCTGAEVAMIALAVAGTGASLYAADTAANQEEANLKFQAAQAEADAAAEKGAAQVEADRIRKAAKAQRAQATAQAAAAGIDVNSPTALKIDQEIVENAEEDAYLTILQGGDRSARMRQQATVDRTGAKIVRTNARAQQTATLISSASSTYSGWKRSSGAGG